MQKKNKIDALFKKLDSIDEKYFIEYFFKKNAEVYKNELTKLLDSKIASVKKDKEEALASIAQKKYQVKLQKAEIEQQKEIFKTNMTGLDDSVSADVLNALIYQSSNITDTASATNIANQALNTALKEKILPVMQDFGKAVKTESLNIPIDLDNTVENLTTTFMASGAFATTVGIAISVAVLPIIGAVLVAIGTWIKSIFGDSKEAKISKLLTSDDMRNKVKAQIADALSKMSDEVVKALTQALTTLDKNLENEKEYVNLIKTKEDKETAIAKVETQKADIKRAYEKLETYSKK